MRLFRMIAINLSRYSLQAVLEHSWPREYSIILPLRYILMLCLFSYAVIDVRSLAMDVRKEVTTSVRYIVFRSVCRQNLDLLLLKRGQNACEKKDMAVIMMLWYSLKEENEFFVWLFQADHHWPNCSHFIVISLLYNSIFRFLQFQKSEGKHHLMSLIVWHKNSKSQFYHRYRKREVMLETRSHHAR